MRRRGSGPSGGFTMIELVVVVIVVGLATSAGAVGLTRQITPMRVRSAAAQLLRTLHMAREAAMNERRTWKVRVHQTRRAPSLAALYYEDFDPLMASDVSILPVTQRTWGTHQIVFTAPVELWQSTLPAPNTYHQTHAFPSTLMAAGDRYDTPAAVFNPILRIITFTPLVTLVAFPNSLANLSLPGMYELPSGVRITQVNAVPTTGGAPTYGTAPFTSPKPANPNNNAVIGNPPRPTGAYNLFDDRIVDVTYAPDGTFRFTPARVFVSGSIMADYTILFESRERALGTPIPEFAMISLDFRSGLAF